MATQGARCLFTMLPAQHTVAYKPQDPEMINSHAFLCMLFCSKLTKG